jgi:hypothetical protein
MGRFVSRFTGGGFGLVLVAGVLVAAPSGLRAAESVASVPAGIVGDYLEARTSDIYTGPCFANAEVNLDGEEAVLAWRVREGSWRGVELSGLAVVAAVKARSTLGDPFGGPALPRSVIVVDERASAEQRESLADLARTLGGELLDDVIAVRSAKVEARFEAGSGYASVRAGDLIEASTRPLHHHHDNVCGNESVFYPPLTSVRDATPAYTLANAYRGGEFDATWSTPQKRSSFVGEFAR